jgi:uncharacterized protein (TIGR02284 family)
MINDYEATEPMTVDASGTPGRMTENSASNDDVISCLNGLIETCRDGQNGFREAAEAVESSDIKAFFAECSQERATFVGELQALVRGLGGDPENSGSTLAAIHRGWIDLKAAIEGNDEKGVLSECERGEDSAKKAYKEALEMDLPGNVRDTVQTQADAVIECHNRVKALRDGYNKSSSSSATGGGTGGF